jgi:hypothetical protein
MRIEALPSTTRQPPPGAPWQVVLAPGAPWQVVIDDAASGASRRLRQPLV